MMTPLIRPLQEKLQDLRKLLETTRPELPPETRQFKYQKPVHNSHGDTCGWEWVTEDITVTLRLFGSPKHEHRCYDLGQEIRQTKDEIIKLGYQPIEHDETYDAWVRRGSPQRGEGWRDA